MKKIFFFIFFAVKTIFSVDYSIELKAKPVLKNIINSLNLINPSLTEPQKQNIVGTLNKLNVLYYTTPMLISHYNDISQVLNDISNLLLLNVIKPAQQTSNQIGIVPTQPVQQTPQPASSNQLSFQNLIQEQASTQPVQQTPQPASSNQLSFQNLTPIQSSLSPTPSTSNSNFNILKGTIESVLSELKRRLENGLVSAAEEPQVREAISYLTKLLINKSITQNDINYISQLSEKIIQSQSTTSPQVNTPSTSNNDFNILKGTIESVLSELKRRLENGLVSAAEEPQVREVISYLTKLLVNKSITQNDIAYIQDLSAKLSQSQSATSLQVNQNVLTTEQKQKVEIDEIINGFNSNKTIIVPSLTGSTLINYFLNLSPYDQGVAYRCMPIPTKSNLLRTFNVQDPEGSFKYLTNVLNDLF